MNTTHVIVNPASGGGRAARREHLLRARLDAAGIRYVLARTRSRGHALALAAEAVRDHAAAVIAVGGDGTVHEVINGLLAAADSHIPPLGVVPVGTGNDFVKAAGGATDPVRLAEAARRGAVRKVDVGRVVWDGGAEYFANAMGVGVDVEVVRQIERLPRLPGMLGYLIGALRALARYRALSILVRTDGEETPIRVLMLAVANGHCIGGGFRVCPDADITDGELDFCLVRDLGLLAVARTLPRVIRGTHAGTPGVSLGRTRGIRIRSADGSPLFFQLDGELRQASSGDGLKVESVPAALPVLVATSRETA